MLRSVTVESVWLLVSNNRSRSRRRVRSVLVWKMFLFYSVPDRCCSLILPVRIGSVRRSAMVIIANRRCRAQMFTGCACSQIRMAVKRLIVIY
jgi:hypothetical protein